jgi:ATP-dependent Clp protease ATP-binding subunit ClpC
MDNNFSAQVKEIISYSREEALRLGNDFIGTEHLVLGLIRDGENTAIKILKSLNVDLYELRKEIELAVKEYCQHKFITTYQAGRKSDTHHSA